MARFRHLHVAGGVEWRHGVPGPWAKWTLPERNMFQTDPADHATATVYHAEQPFTLEVMPKVDRRNGHDRPMRWTWGIFQNGRDPDNHHLTDSEWTFPGALGDRYYPESHPKSGSGYIGMHVPTREEAMRQAEEAWEAHKAHVDSLNPLRNDDYDLNSFMRDHDPEEGGL